MEEESPESNQDHPCAVDRELVGKYNSVVRAGGGYFYDDVLEYRVWMSPEMGAVPSEPGDLGDYYYSFYNYGEALMFSRENIGAEEPLALVRQLYWIRETENGLFEVINSERIAEWKVEWLKNGSAQKLTLFELRKTILTIRTKAHGDSLNG